jgi:hypothetical protein
MAAGGFTSGIVRPIAKLVMSWNDANAKYRWCTRSSLVPVRRTDDFCGPDRRVLGNDHLTRAASSEKRLLAIGHAAAHADERDELASSEVEHGLLPGTRSGAYSSLRVPWTHPHVLGLDLNRSEPAGTRRTAPRLTPGPRHKSPIARSF